MTCFELILYIACVIYCRADPDAVVRNALIIVMHDGFVQWIPHQLFQSSCKIDVTNFPFDGQTVCFHMIGVNIC